MKSHFLLRSSLLILACFGAFTVSPSAPAQPQALSYVDLVHRITDLEYLATLPAPGDQCAQWSSYDRKSRYDAATDRYLNWDANGDGNGIIRREGDKEVMAEMEGPGCIWRTWSAMPQEGHVRIYLDGAAEPVIDLPFKGYFDGKNEPFTRKTLVHTVARGWNNYTPIPYQKSCKIVADKGWGAYFHFVYETFPKGTQVPTFKRELGPEDLAALDQADVLLNNGGVVQKSSEDRVLQRTIEARPGSHANVVTLKGPRALKGIRVKLDLPAAPADLDFLRELCLQINWDGEKQPAVWAPLGDFFGTAPGANRYRSYTLGLTDDGWWYCNWYMPFGKEAKIQLVNNGTNIARRVTFEITHSPLSRPLEQLARFHAKWHRDAFLPTAPDRQIDWPVLKTEGSGRFVGMMLHIWNPRGGWWGEGDEKFFVDGEKFPSTFGTGSEDYFGYAWSDPGLFQHAFHNQTHNDGNSRGHISVNRWHIPDNVPFHTGFEGDLEKYYPNQRPTLYAAMAYWYLSADGKDPYAPVALNERVGYWTPVQSVKAKDVLEGESLKVLSKTGGDPQEQDMTGFGESWSGDAHLWWINAKPGDKLDLALPVAKAGTYRLGLQLTKAPDYGIVQLYLDGQKLGEPLDLYHSSVVASGLLRFGQRELSAGQHKLTIEVLGANDKAIKNYMSGLDYVKLEPVIP
ncbi:MAG TPA: glycoside hydrolase family 172 protein [Verrucomicrobiae bacterium]|nr:glycoside hydrolase family 172 protein [Verrucomicrobiae bacterium]